MSTRHQDTYTQFKGWRAEDFGRYKRHWAAYYRREIDHCLEIAGASADRPLRLLEIGFGNGSFLGWARDQKHTCVGIEIESEQLATARNAGFLVAGYIEELKSRHDLCGLDGVVAIDVFEHLTYPQLVGLLRQLHSLLSPRGWIFARFPNGDSPFGRLTQHGDLTHVTTLGSTGLSQLAHAAGYELAMVGSDRLPIYRAGLIRGVVNSCYQVVRLLGELPLQLLMNAYFPGVLRWYPLAPNLVARFVVRGAGA